MSRLVDRSLRPAFAPGWTHDTQVGRVLMLHRHYKRVQMLLMGLRLVFHSTSLCSQFSCSNTASVAATSSAAQIVVAHLQVLQWVMSYDNANATEALAITAASAALAVSGVLHNGANEHPATPQQSWQEHSQYITPRQAAVDEHSKQPPHRISASAVKLRLSVDTDIPASRVVAGVRVGLLEGQGFVVNPTVEQMEHSTLDLLLAGSVTAVLMIEGFAEFLPEEQLLEVRLPKLSSCSADLPSHATGGQHHRGAHGRGLRRLLAPGAAVAGEAAVGHRKVGIQRNWPALARAGHHALRPVHEALLVLRLSET